MKIIRARGVNQALPMGVEYLLHSGLREETRVGPALVSPVPVVTVYSEPRERVLFSAVRDANPFFHLAESLWMLLGRGDAAFLNRFISNFGERFAEEDGMVHGAYGRRWRNHFIESRDEDGSNPIYIDQLAIIIAELRTNPSSRQVVLTMWDPEVDLGVVGLKDRPCNTQVYFRIRSMRTVREGDLCSDKVLDMTVCCRSNDIVMGAYGANAVHFSMLQEYVAAMVGCSVGFYYQVSNNYHAYQRDLDALDKRNHDSGGHYPLSIELGSTAYRELNTKALVDDPLSFNAEMVMLVRMYESGEWAEPCLTAMNNKFLSETVRPMLQAHSAYRSDPYLARSWAEQVSAPDWRRAAVEWVGRRITKMEDARAQG